MQTNGFILRDGDGVPYYACEALEKQDGVQHGFSARHGGVSLPPEGILNLGFVAWDAPTNVEENRRRFLAALGIRPESLATAYQTHSAEFHIINAGSGQWNPRTHGDALITADRGLAVAVKTADCFPVLIADPHTGTIAAIHAGWRGILGGVLHNTLAGMCRGRTSSAGLIAAIGPGIRSCCFEVGFEVASAFESAFPEIGLSTPHAQRAGKFMVDLPRALQQQLAGAGVPAANIFDLGLCTCCRPH
jgi:YfiH family protein